MSSAKMIFLVACLAMIVSLIEADDAIPADPIDPETTEGMQTASNSTVKKSQDQLGSVGLLNIVLALVVKAQLGVILVLILKCIVSLSGLIALLPALVATILAIVLTLVGQLTGLLLTLFKGGIRQDEYKSGVDGYVSKSRSDMDGYKGSGGDDAIACFLGIVLQLELCFNLNLGIGR